MKQGVFKYAVLKLTLIYTGIIAFICLGFSLAFWFTTNNELNRPFSPKQEIVRMEISEDSMDIILRQRNEQTRDGLLMNLLAINMTVLLVGAASSYFLAQITLDPIRKMTEQQAHFISNASHELRTPLTAITMENEVALRDKSLTKPELTGIIKSNLEETKKLQKLINYMLSLDQEDKVELNSTDVHDVVTTVIERNKTIANAKNIKIKNNVKNYIIRSNEEVLESVLNILVDNAIKYSPEKSTVNIGVRENKIFVADEGPGIPDNDLPYIFDRFYRAEKSRTSDGYGLGLSLAKQSAEKIKMTISVENNKDKGTIFYLS